MFGIAYRQKKVTAPKKAGAGTANAAAYNCNLLDRVLSGDSSSA
jgi:hypothetical protein